MRPRSVFMGAWNLNRGPWNVIMESRNVIMGLSNVNRGPWNVLRGPAM